MASSSRRPVNMRNWAVKRIMQEAAELANPDEDDFVAGPLESDIFEWHCTVRGVQGTDYEGGLYHLRIVLPSSYPMSAPDIILMTPNGRFELNKKICIDGLTSFHAGSWQPAWGVRTAITGLRSFWTQDGEALSAIGALDYPKEERRRLAKLSREWTCPTCQESNGALLPDPAPRGNAVETLNPATAEATVEEAQLVGGGGDSSGTGPEPIVASPPPGAEPQVMPSTSLTEDPTPNSNARDLEPQAESDPNPAPPAPAARPVPPPALAAAPTPIPAVPPAPVATTAPEAPVAPLVAAPDPALATPLPEPTTGAVPPGPTSGPAVSAVLAVPPTPTTPAVPPAVAPRAAPSPAFAPASAAVTGASAGAVHVPARFTQRPNAAARRSAPLWLDVLIGSLVMLLLALIWRY